MISVAVAVVVRSHPDPNVRTEPKYMRKKHFLIKCESRKRRKNVCRLDEARSVRGRGDEVPTEEKREEKRRKKRFQNVCGGGKIRGEKAASGG
jgi:hypothetical protein